MDKFYLTRLELGNFINKKLRAIAKWDKCLIIVVLGLTYLVRGRVGWVGGENDDHLDCRIILLNKNPANPPSWAFLYGGLAGNPFEIQPGGHTLHLTEWLPTHPTGNVRLVGIL